MPYFSISPNKYHKNNRIMDWKFCGAGPSYSIHVCLSVAVGSSEAWSSNCSVKSDGRTLVTLLENNGKQYSGKLMEPCFHACIQQYLFYVLPMLIDPCNDRRNSCVSVEKPSYQRGVASSSPCLSI